MPDIIDIFSGVGGLSLGAARAGFRVRAAVELDKHALDTHRMNFPLVRHANADVSRLTGRELLRIGELEPGQLDGLIGGPPCQGFSTMGLREDGDERNQLFDHFFRLVREVRPKFFVAENVPGIMHKQYDQLRENALGRVANRYVMLEPFAVAANDYGAPTTRTRILFIGYNRSHVARLTKKSFEPPAGTTRVTVSHAFEGLPTIVSPDWQAEEDGWRMVGRPTPSLFGQKMSGCVPDEVGNEESLVRYTCNREVSGFLGTRHSKSVMERYAAMEPGKQDKVSKSTRLRLDGFCPTLRAGTGKDKGSYQAVRPLHPTEPRVITPREAARLQGFPDWFRFHGTKWHSFRQIGNSVSPILAEAILKVVMNRLR